MIQNSLTWYVSVIMELKIMITSLLTVTYRDLFARHELMFNPFWSCSHVCQLFWQHHSVRLFVWRHLNKHWQKCWGWHFIENVTPSTTLVHAHHCKSKICSACSQIHMLLLQIYSYKLELHTLERNCMNLTKSEFSYNIM